MSKQSEHAWFSLALEYGLAFVSFGKAGSSSEDTDDQLITGGLTAVENLLTTEIGLDKKESFVVDHGSSRMERIPIKTNDGDLIYAQFLIQTIEEGKKVKDQSVELARLFITELADQFLASKQWAEIKVVTQILGASDILPIIMDVTEKVQRKSKVKTNETKIIDYLNSTIARAFTKFEFSKALKNLASQEEESVEKFAKENKKKLINQFYFDIYSKIIQDNPLIFIKTATSFFKKGKSESVVNSILEDLKEELTDVCQAEVMDGFFSDDSLQKIMKKFDVIHLRDNRNELRKIVENQITIRMWQQAPLVGLINPKFETKGESFRDFIQNRVLERVFDEYDIGEIIAKAAETFLMKSESSHLQADLVGEFFRDIFLRFPGGLPERIWQVITNLLIVFATDKKTLLKLPEHMEVTDAHWKVLEKRFKSYRHAKLPQFSENSREVLHFVEGVRKSIARALVTFYTKFIWDQKLDEFGIYIHKLNENSERIFQSLQRVFYIHLFLNRMLEKKYTYHNPLIVPVEYNKYKRIVCGKKNNENISLDNMEEFTLDNFHYYYITRVQECAKSDIFAISNYVKVYENHFKRLEKFGKELLKKESHQIIKEAIPKPRNPKIPEDSELHFLDSKKYPKNIEKIDKIWNDMQNTFEKFSNNLNNIYSKSKAKASIELPDLLKKYKESFSKQIKDYKDLLQQNIKLIDSEKSSLNSAISEEAKTLYKELEKSIEKKKLKTIIETSEKDKVKMRMQVIDKLKEMYSKEMNKIIGGDKLLEESNFLYAYILSYLFDEIDEEFLQDSMKIAIENPKLSNLIQKTVSKVNKMEKYEFVECLKEEVTKAGDEMLKISKTIIAPIIKNYTTEDYPLRIFFNHSEILGIGAGQLRKEFKEWQNQGVQIHPSIIVNFDESSKVNIYLEITKRPSVGEVEYIWNAIALDTANQELSILGLFIESIKMISSTLGENERRKIQRFFDTITFNLSL